MGRVKKKVLQEIPRRSRECLSCGIPFKPEMNYVSAVAEQGEGWERKDFCLKCWESSDSRREGSSTYWKATVPKKTKKEISIERETRALQLLKEAVANEQQTGEAYILALFLVRRRWLILRKEMTQENDQTLGLYEIPTTEEIIPVRKIDLNTIEIETIQKQIAQKLESLG